VQKFPSPNIKNCVYHVLFTCKFKIDQSMLIWQFLYLCQFFGSKSLRISRILTVLSNSTPNLSATKQIKEMKMKLLVQIALLQRSFNFSSATQFDEGRRAAQTSRLVHVSSPSYEWHICSAATRRIVSSRTDFSMNLNTTPSLLPNCRKLFL